MSMSLEEFARQNGACINAIRARAQQSITDGAYPSMAPPCARPQHSVNDVFRATAYHSEGMTRMPADAYKYAKRQSGPASFALHRPRYIYSAVESLNGIKPPVLPSSAEGPCAFNRNMRYDDDRHLFRPESGGHASVFFYDP